MGVLANQGFVNGEVLTAASALVAGHVRVHLGKDYAGPDVQGSTAPAAFHLDDPPAQQAPAADSLAAGGVACIN